MDPVRIVTGTAVPLDRSDVDTDQIIPSDWLKRVERTGFGQGLFSEWRDRPGLRPQPAAATPAPAILVAGPNFGTGSSAGARRLGAASTTGSRPSCRPASATSSATTAPRPAWCPVQVDAEVGEPLLRAVEADPTLEVTIDVEARTLAAPAAGIETTFPLDDSTRWRLLEGLDDIGLTLRHEDDIAAYEATRPAWLPDHR